MTKKKADATEHPWVFHRVGLLINERPGNCPAAVYLVFRRCRKSESYNSLNPDVFMVVRFTKNINEVVLLISPMIIFIAIRRVICVDSQSFLIRADSWAASDSAKWGW
jgi:hypothetical protein